MEKTEPTEPSNLREDARKALPYASLSGILQILLSLIGILLLVRYLPADSYGAWMMMLGLAAPIFLLTSIGFRHSLIRFMPALETRYEKARLIWSVLFRRLLLLFLICFVLYFTFPFYAESIGLVNQLTVFTVLLPTYMILAVNQYLVLTLNATFRQREVLAGSVIQQIIGISGVLIGIQAEQGLLYFAYVQLVANASASTFNAIAVIRYVGGPTWSDLRMKHSENSEELHYRRASFVDDLGSMLLSADISRIIIASFSTNFQVAIYSVAVSIVDRLRALIPMEIFRPLATVTFFRRHEETGTIEEVNRMFAFIFAINRIVAVAFLAFFIPLGQEALIWLFRSDYGGSYLPALLLLVTIGIVGMPVGLVAQALNRPQFLVYSKLAVLVQIAVAISLVPAYGAIGMASAVLLSELARNLIVLGLLRREFPIRYPWASTFRFFLAAVVVSGLLWVLQAYMHFIFAAVLGLFAWALSIRAFRLLNSDEKKLLATMVPEKFQKASALLFGS